MEKPANRSFRLRGTRMTQSQAASVEKYWDQYRLPDEGLINLTEIFPTFEKVIMEIGTGMGEATAEIARNFPETAFIGVEVHKPGLGALLHKINEYELNEVKPLLNKYLNYTEYLMDHPRQYINYHNLPSLFLGGLNLKNLNLKSNKSIHLKNYSKYLINKKYKAYEINVDGSISTHYMKANYKYDNLIFIPEEKINLYDNI